MDRIQQNLENMEKYLMVSQLENSKLNNGVKASGPRLRGYLQNIMKECSEARRLILDISKTLPSAKSASKKINKDSLDDSLNLSMDQSFIDSLPLQGQSQVQLGQKKPSTRGRKPKVLS